MNRIGLTRSQSRFPFKSHPNSVQIPVKFHSNSFQIPSTYCSNSSQIPRKFQPNSIHIPYKSYSNSIQILHTFISNFMSNSTLIPRDFHSHFARAFSNSVQFHAILHSYSVRIPLKFHSHSNQIRFNCHSIPFKFREIPFKFESNSIQISRKFRELPFEFQSSIQIQIPFLFHSYQSQFKFNSHFPRIPLQIPRKFCSTFTRLPSTFQPNSMHILCKLNSNSITNWIQIQIKSPSNFWQNSSPGTELVAKLIRTCRKINSRELNLEAI